jgi:hypothetical protein
MITPLVAKMQKTLALARGASTPGEAEAAWLRTAELAARVGVTLGTIWTTDGKALTDAGIWPAVVDAWHDAKEGN